MDDALARRARSGSRPRRGRRRRPSGRTAGSASRAAHRGEPGTRSSPSAAGARGSMRTSERVVGSPRPRRRGPVQRPRWCAQRSAQPRSIASGSVPPSSAHSRVTGGSCARHSWKSGSAETTSGASPIAPHEPRRASRCRRQLVVGVEQQDELAGRRLEPERPPLLLVAERVLDDAGAVRRGDPQRPVGGAAVDADHVDGAVVAPAPQASRARPAASPRCRRSGSPRSPGAPRRSRPVLRPLGLERLRSPGRRLVARSLEPAVAAVEELAAEHQQHARGDQLDRDQIWSGFVVDERVEAELQRSSRRRGPRRRRVRPSARKWNM